MPSKTGFLSNLKILAMIPMLLITTTLVTQIIYLSSEVLVPSVKYQTITWLDDEGFWIIDASVATESYWNVGRVVNVSVNAILRQAPSNKSLHIVVRILTKDGLELSSKYLGELSIRSRSTGGFLYLVVSSPYFTVSNTTPSYSYALRVVFEGFRDGRVFKQTFEFPVTIVSARSLVLPTVIINESPNYHFLFESLSTLNLSVLLRNHGSKNIAWVVVEVFLNNELVGRRYVDGLSPGGVQLVSMTLFKYLTPGLYEVKAVAKYSLPEGVEESVSASGIIEVSKAIKAVLSSDKTSVVEGSKIVFDGCIMPAYESFVILEKLVDKVWVPLNATTSKVNKCFSFEWVAEDVELNVNYVEHFFRIRVPLSAIGSTASITSNIVSVVVYNAKRVGEFIADITLGLEPDMVFRGSKTLVNIRITPRIPVCIPVKIAYLDQDLYTWFELDTIYVCDGVGNGSVKVDLAPGKYSVKALIPSTYRVIESLPKPLTILDIPRLLINAPTTTLYGGDLPISIQLSPPMRGTFNGYVYIEREIPSNTSVVILDGHAGLVLKNITYEGDLAVNACVNVYENLICNKTYVKVLKVVITITPSSTTVEVNSPVEYTIIASPPGRYDILLTLSDGSKLLETRTLVTDYGGKASVNLIAPSKSGSYVVTATLHDTKISATARLNVIEFIKSLTIELLNKTVQQSDRVYVRVIMRPPPTTPHQVMINIQEGGKWNTVSYGITASDVTTMSFTAPGSEGQYRVKAVIQDLNIESNVEILNVVSASLLPTEYLYILIASTVIGGSMLYVLGRRRK